VHAIPNVGFEKRPAVLGCEDEVIVETEISGHVGAFRWLPFREHSLFGWLTGGGVRFADIPPSTVASAPSGQRRGVMRQCAMSIGSILILEDGSSRPRLAGTRCTWRFVVARMSGWWISRPMNTSNRLPAPLQGAFPVWFVDRGWRPLRGITPGYHGFGLSGAGISRSVSVGQR